MKQQNDILQPVSIEEIQKMLEEKSLALEKLQSELEVESALERVRAVAMSMKKSEDLFDVCKVMYEELTALNFTNIRNAQIAINLGQYKSWLIFEYSKYGEIKMKKVDSSISPLLKEIAEEMSNSKDALKLFQKQIKGEEFKKWRAWRLKEDALKDPRVEEANSMCFYLHGIEAGILGISSFDAITNEQVEILNRFKNVFDLSYTRYADVAKAEAQAREAQIELGLERVRARAMAMQKSDDLAGAVAIIFEELDKLDIGILRCGIGILNKENRSVNVWTTSISDENVPVQISGDQSMDSHPLLQGAFNAWLKQEDYSYILQGKDLTDYYKAQAGANFKLPDSQSLITANEGLCQYYFLATFQAGGLFAFRESPFPEEGKKVMKRFADVFNLTYKRFSDLKTAEAQAREAQIEAALEKVRSRSLAMHKSDELQEVVNTLFEKLQELDIQADSANIAIFKEGTRDYDYWVASHFQKRAASFHMPYTELLLTKDLIAARESGADFSAKAYSFEEKNEWFNYAFINTDFKFLSEERKQFILGSKGISVSIAFGKNTGVQVVNYSGNLLSETEADILKRFSRVFEQAYTRFLDLQKAEAQAKEAQIEAALEKVRSRSLAMHKSDEIQEVLHAVFEKMKELDIDFYTAIIILFTKGSKDIIWWLESKANQLYPKILVPYAEIDYLRKLFEARDNGMELFSKCYSFEEKNELFHHLFKHTDFKDAPEEQKKFLLETGFATMSVALAKNTGIHLTSYSKESFSEQDNEVLKRFAKVFEQAYTRFLDLQQAEAQARESQIQLALERVRARTMAMQKSEELKEVIRSVYDQFGHLNIHIEHTGFIMDYKARDDMHIWLADKHAVPFQVTLPYFDCAHWNSFNEAKEKGENFFANHLSFEEKNKFYQDLFKLIPGVPEETLEYYFSCSGLAISTVLLENVGLYIENFSGIPYTDEENATLMRFGKVFQQTYTRFLDLQKAEAQARESQIQLALERVRAKTMAMHKSEELAELSFELVKQVQTLGVATWHCAFNIYDEDQNSSTEWGSNAGGTYPRYKTPRVGIFRRYYEIGQTGETLHIEVIGEDKCADHYSFLCTLPGVGEQLVKLRDSGVSFPTSQIDHVAYFKYGYLLFITYEPVPEAHGIFKRFAKVFEQTYTRFLDLQKAEAQAKEARIEAVLEKVRSRTMAMQKSNELTDVAGLLFEQVSALGIKTWTAGFNVWSEDNNSYIDYITSPNGGFIEPYTVLTDTAEALRDISNARKSGVEFDVQYVEGEKIKQLYLALTKLDEKQYEIMLQDGIRFPSHQYEHFVFGSKVSLMFITYEPVPEAHDIFKRLGKVFEQTYTRFLDLQKAEAQARESQIQLALERVRARTMAMQKSDELPETSYLLFQQVKELGLTAAQNSIAIINEETGFVELSTTVHGHHLPHTLNVLMDDPYVMAKAVTAWKAKLKSLKVEVRGQELKDYNEHRNSFFEKKVNFPEDQWIVNLVFFSKGWLSFSSDKNISDETFDVLKRFAAVFEQTYTRFNDLKQAEAQARESQIQLALERVRAGTMAMQKHEDLLGVLGLLVEQLIKLGVQLEVADFSNGIPNGDWDLWIEVVRGDGTTVNNYVHFPRIDHPYFHQVEKNIETFKSTGKDLFKDVFSKEDKDLWQEYVYTQTIYKDITTEKDWEYLYDKPGYAWSMILLKDTWVSICRYNTTPFSDEEDALFRRFVNAFGQAYTRFLDLQKAEAQAREAEIQLALERVRARTMAMYKSNELAETARVLFTEFKKLNVLTDVGIPDRAFISTVNEKKGVIEFWITALDGSQINRMFEGSIKEPIVFNKAYKAWKKQKKSLVIDVSGNDLIKYLDYLKSIDFPVNEELYELHRVNSVAFFSKGFIGITSLTLLPSESIQMMERFASVFEQTYTRFLDLQKAEAQAKESGIQLALERVRARTMAMQRSDELMETAVVLFDQLNQLGENIERTMIGVINEEEHVVEVWATRPDGSQMDKMQKFPIDEPILMQRVYVAWRQQKKSIVIDLRDEELESYFQFLKGRGSRLKRESFGERRVENFAFFSKGILGVINADPKIQANVELYERFASVFEQTYTRFLDLQTAEALARESQIQLALERVRARTMAMQHSDELKDAAALLFQQAKALGVPAYSCGYNIWEKKDKTFTSWMSTQDGSIINGVPDIPLTEDANFIRYVESKQKGEQFFVLELRGERMQEHYEYLKTIPAFKAYFDYAVSVGFNLPETQIHYLANFSQGNLLFISLEPCPEFHDVFKRFASVFEQTYTRFLDLQKAEAQSREAQIELGLERVRARAMAMQNSDELKGLIGTVFIELTKLDLVLTRCLIIIYDTQTNGSTWWMANSEAPADPIGLYVKNHQLPPYVAYIKAWKERKNKWQYILEGKDKNGWDDFLFVETELSQLPDFVIAGMKAPDRVCLSASFNNFGCLNLASLEPLSDDHFDILLRFGKVFDLTYTRFNDLKQAEAQAREATIEAALEKVRGKAMAMHNSNDVSSTASLVFTELRKLEINPIRCGVGLLTKDSRKAQLYSATSSADGDSLALIGWVQLSDHPVLTKIYDTWLNNEEYYPELQGEAMRTYYQLLLKGLPVSVPDTTDSPKQYGHFIPFSIGCLYAWSDTHYDQPKLKILKRFALIIDLTFRRYIELQKSEANARDAIKQSALDRIRADIASMRTTTDLERITPLIWNELTILGISFIRCGIFIMDDAQELIHTFLSTPEGKAIAAFHLPYASPGNISQVLSHWRNKKNYVDHWDKSAFTEFAEILVEQGGLASAEQYLKTVPGGGFYLHFVPFLQGMLYVGNTTQLGEEEINLIQSVADAFSTAYARYEDFNKLEFAKQHVEKTLVDLKQAQTQLIQAEKMASLGELTAGIAHEIQNPLNFVNNFSEVNAELLFELKDEISKGNINEAKNIANDLIDNEQKINHHGKRADAIVKGMLQHSRISTGQKEFTNINTLADEYLRLAYHGMRAKDNFFNVTIKTDFDESIEKIKIIPQDIGRVILNLITNAFYAVNEKKKKQHDGYEPIVTVSTKRLSSPEFIPQKAGGDGGKVEIKVSDNGNGIPEKVLDKIFQPFFTTKPTGQGTGLGLSLSYDIIKAHGGEIKVETKEEEGTMFIIQLPVQRQYV